jgi:hypothetical protein
VNDRPIQSPKAAWILALRAEVLRPQLREQLTGRQLRHLALVGTVGNWIASFADADGGGAYPERETIAALAGCSVETVSRAVRVLVGLGVLARRRRPNQSPVYQLLMPVGRLDWPAALAWFGDSRQRSWIEKKRRAEAEEQDRKASTDAVRKASVDCVPESVQGRSPSDPESVHGRPWKASTDAVRKASTDAPTTTHLPAVGDHHPDQDVADVQQPPTGRGRARAKPKPIQPPILAAVPDNEPHTEPPPEAPPGAPPPSWRQARKSGWAQTAEGAS